MGEFVGVTHLPRVNSSLKRESLIFKRTGIPGYKKTANLLKMDLDNNLLNEIDWLLEQGIVFDLDDPREIGDNSEAHLLLDQLSEQIEKILNEPPKRLNRPLTLTELLLEKRRLLEMRSQASLYSETQKDRINGSRNEIARGRNSLYIRVQGPVR